MKLQSLLSTPPLGPAPVCRGSNWPLGVAATREPVDYSSGEAVFPAQQGQESISPKDDLAPPSTRSCPFYGVYSHVCRMADPAGPLARLEINTYAGSSRFRAAALRFLRSSPLPHPGQCVSCSR